MTNLPPTISEPSVRVRLVDPETGYLTSDWGQILSQWFKRLGGGPGIPIVGDIAVYQTTVGQAALASGASAALLTAATGEQWKVREIFLSGAGTDFSGGGGDRLLAITDGTTIWSVIPAATLQSLAVARWGDTGVPFPATAAHLTTASAAGTNISATYSGGTTDYTAGSLTLVLVAERVA